MTPANEEKRTVEEAYTSAMTSSNLRVEAERPGDADVIIAAGWNQVRIGAALLRLHTEWDASEKPRMATHEQFLPGLPPGPAKERKAAAHRRAHEFNLHEMGLMLQRLKELPAVRTQLTMQALKWGMGRSDDPISRSERSEEHQHDDELLKRLRGIVAQSKEDPAALEVANAELAHWAAEIDKKRRAEGAEDMDRCGKKVVAILRWWLSQTCPVCQGTKFQKAEGTNRLTAKACKGCSGTGMREIPHGQEGRRLANWIDGCVEKARASIGSRLRDLKTP